MSKWLFDRIAAAVGLLLLSPLLVPIAIALWLQDRHSPFYIATRVGRHGRPFRMVKFRSMVVRADRTGVDSTAANDPRITRLGHFMRRFKLDELPQLWNVLAGEMSLVGPRPNVERDVALYTDEERRLLSVLPGLTDFSSIVFSDEGEILRGSADPDLRYNQVIRPWKSRLGLLYVRQVPNLGLDLRIILLTMRATLNRPGALHGVSALIRRLGDPDLADVATRTRPPAAAPPPGATEVVTSRTPAPSAAGGPLLPDRVGPR